ncbi:hypothetical protein LTR62_002463 [Meristemomyces frigidus]|uniref:Uncharacterized protein n=1 Tax=Meristemomyces frigidus TaxID=1508187 RepID=A0AAN7TSY9_9PEZI|nr:hypothetical protein LTR62_002463 [Meristemomyces frigidus]
MSSHLTRQVFRQLLANEPITFRGCLRRRHYHVVAPKAPAVITFRRCNGIGPQYRSLQQRRGFLNMFRMKPKREAKEADMDPGLDVMMELEKRTRLKARLPSKKEVAQASQAFFESKFKNRQPVEDNQARLALQSLRYCSEGEADLSTAGGGQTLVSDRTIYEAARGMRVAPTNTTNDHMELANWLVDFLGDKASIHASEAVRLQARTLCDLGRVSDAREAILLFEKRAGSFAQQYLPDDENVNQRGTQTATAGTFMVLSWAQVISGFAAQGAQKDVATTLDLMRQRGWQDKKAITEAVLHVSLAKKDRHHVEESWRSYYNSISLVISAAKARNDLRQQRALLGDSFSKTIRLALMWCLANDATDVGHRIVKDLMQDNPVKSIWDTIFVWAAGTGKGVDEIGRMIDVMEKSNDALEDAEDHRLPDSATVNALVEWANSKDDPYTAERFIALGRERGIEPDAKTFVLQMAYRLRGNDIDGALTAYKNLQATDLSSDEDIPVVNDLLGALCSSPRHDFDTIMNIVADLSDRRARFSPTTVAKLSLLHLNRDELHDVIDLLNTHAYHYSSAERTSVREPIVAFCLAPTTPISRAWDAYTILRNTFDELDREVRTRLMTNFFARDRPDMAVHVFNHMRSHSRADTMPTVDTYITAFIGTAKRRDLESLEVLHNQLKLDFNINLNTRLRNALIIGYTSCGRPRKALQFWDDIVASREGPSYNSIHIALRACERSPFGDIRAQEIWTRLRKMNIELDNALWAGYVAALAGNGNVENAIVTLIEAEKRGEVEVDGFVVGSLFMGAPGREKQGEVEAWARREYGDVWEELVKGGVEEAEDGTRAFGIDRSVVP